MFLVLLPTDIGRDKSSASIPIVKNLNNSPSLWAYQVLAYRQFDRQCRAAVRWYLSCAHAAAHASWHRLPTLLLLTILSPCVRKESHESTIPSVSAKEVQIPFVLRIIYHTPNIKYIAIWATTHTVNYPPYTTSKYTSSDKPQYIIVALFWSDQTKTVPFNFKETLRSTTPLYKQVLTATTHSNGTWT